MVSESKRHERKRPIDGGMDERTPDHGGAFEVEEEVSCATHSQH